MLSALKMYVTVAAFNSDFFREIIDTIAQGILAVLREILDALNVKSSKKICSCIEVGSYAEYSTKLQSSSFSSLWYANFWQ